jgi:hypothetical protein
VFVVKLLSVRFINSSILRLRVLDGVRVYSCREYVHGLVEKTIPSTTRMPLHAFVGEIVFRFAARMFRNCYEKNSQRTSTSFLQKSEANRA